MPAAYISYRRAFYCAAFFDEIIDISATHEMGGVMMSLAYVIIMHISCKYFNLYFQGPT